MTIIEKDYAWAGSFAYRKETNRIILHHAAAESCSADDVHAWHLDNGWTGIGYHFFVSKDGSIYRGRPESAVGSHASGSNSDSIGICFEGNFEVETMPAAQMQAGRELVQDLQDRYDISLILGHRDVATAGTACPGKNFPFDAVAYGTTDKEENKEGKVMVEVRELYEGCTGGDVKAVQAILIANGYNCGVAGADGIFGAGTLRGVKAFQKQKGLAVDGIVGKDTWPTLFA